MAVADACGQQHSMAAAQHRSNQDVCRSTLLCERGTGKKPRHPTVCACHPGESGEHMGTWASHHKQHPLPTSEAHAPTTTPAAAHTPGWPITPSPSKAYKAVPSPSSKLGGPLSTAVRGGEVAGMRGCLSLLLSPLAADCSFRCVYLRGQSRTATRRVLTCQQQRCSQGGCAPRCSACL